MAIATPNPHHTTGHRPWNKWHLIGPKPPLKLPEVWGIRIRLQIEHNTRQLALFNLAIDSKLRGCDLVSLQVRGVIHGNQAVKRAAVIQKKTDWPVQFELTPQTRQAAEKWVSKAHLQPGDYLFSSRMHDSPHISTRALRETRKVLGGRARLGPAEYGTHSLRRTKATLVCRRTRNLGAVQRLLGHTKLESTVRYLGIEVDDALETSEQTEV